MSEQRGRDGTVTGRPGKPTRATGRVAPTIHERRSSSERHTLIRARALAGQVARAGPPEGRDGGGQALPTRPSRQARAAARGGRQATTGQTPKGRRLRTMMLCLCFWSCLPAALRFAVCESCHGAPT